MALYELSKADHCKVMKFVYALKSTINLINGL